MTQTLFTAWLQQFDNHVGRTEGREVLLLAENCTALDRADDIPDLDHF